MSSAKDRRFLRVLVERWRSILLGGIAFWLPDLLYDCIAKREPTTVAIVMLTLIMPFAACLAYFGSRATGRNRSVASSMLLGIWLLGPTMIMLGQTYEGAGFRHVQSLPYWILGTVFPPVTLLLAGFDLSIGALLLGTGALLLARRVCERSESIQQPS